VPNKQQFCVSTPSATPVNEGITTWQISKRLLFQKPLIEWYCISMESENKHKWLYILSQIILGIVVFNWLIPSVETLPTNDKIKENENLESFSDDNLPLYDDMGMPIRKTSSDVIKFQENQNNEDDLNDPFKPKDPHVPGGLPMISDSAFSLTILIYVSVAFLLVFFLFCWKTNGNGNVNATSEETLKQQCPLMTNNPPEPNVIPPTPTKMIEDFD